MAQIRQELFKVLEEIQNKIRSNTPLTDDELEVLLLSSLIEEEA